MLTHSFDSCDCTRFYSGFFYSPRIAQRRPKTKIVMCGERVRKSHPTAEQIFSVEPIADTMDFQCCMKCLLISTQNTFLFTYSMYIRNRISHASTRPVIRHNLCNQITFADGPLRRIIAHWKFSFQFERYHDAGSVIDNYPWPQIRMNLNHPETKNHAQRKIHFISKFLLRHITISTKHAST